MKRVSPIASYLLLVSLFGAACKSKDARTSTSAVSPPPSVKGTAPAPTPPAPRSLAVGKAPAAPVPLAEYFKLRRVRGATFNHDETLVAYQSDEGGRMDLWVQPVAGGPARQITRTKGYLHGYAFSPTRDELVFGADAGGDEQGRLYLTNSCAFRPT